MSKSTRTIRLVIWCAIALVGGSFILDGDHVIFGGRDWPHEQGVAYAILFGVSLFVFLVGLFLARYRR